MPKNPTEKRGARVHHPKARGAHRTTSNAPRAKAPPAKGAADDAVDASSLAETSAEPARVETAGPSPTLEASSEVEGDSSIQRILEEVRHWANKGRYTKVRLKFRGKQVLPDLPMAAFLAAEGLTLYLGGLRRALFFNAAGKSLLQVELVSDADKYVTEGKEQLLSGDIDQALACFRKAVDIDRQSASGHLNVGVALRIRGETEGARAAFEHARELDPAGPVGAEAERLLATLPPRVKGQTSGGS